MSTPIVAQTRDDCPEEPNRCMPGFHVARQPVVCCACGAVKSGVSLRLIGRICLVNEPAHTSHGICNACARDNWDGYFQWLPIGAAHRRDVGRRHG